MTTTWPPPASGSPFDFNAPSGGPALQQQASVVQEAVAADGTTWQKMSDGTTRQKPMGAPDPFGAGVAAGPASTSQPPLYQQQNQQPAAAAPPWGAPAAGGAAAPPWGGGPPAAAPGMGQPVPEYLDVDQQVAGQKPPIGTFDCRLATCEGGRSNAQSVNKDTGQPWHMVKMTLEIVTGRDSQGADVTGREMRTSYLLDPKFNQKTGRWNSSGVAEIREDLQKAGCPPFPQGFRFPTNEVEAARIVATGLSGRTFRVMSYDEERTKNNQKKTFTRVRIVGAAGASVAPAGATGGDPFGGMAAPR